MTLPGRSRIDRGSYGGKLGRNRCGALVVIVRLYLPAHAAAQAVDVSAVCWRPQPRAQCRTFLLANVGIHARLREVSAGGEGPAAVVLDYGLMVNVTSRDAVGASVFASLETNDAVGPAIHYRRWVRWELFVRLGAWRASERQAIRGVRAPEGASRLFARSGTAAKTHPSPVDDVHDDFMRAGDEHAVWGHGWPRTRWAPRCVGHRRGVGRGPRVHALLLLDPLATDSPVPRSIRG